MLLAAESLKAFAADILLRLKVPEWKARLVAESLVTANLRGVDSHGVQLLPYYVDQIRAGNIKPEKDGHIVQESGACLVYDGENGIGQAVAATCADHAVRIGREHGMAMVMARESSHFGAAAFWAQRIAAEGFLGITACNASPQVAPWQGTDRRIGTNPIAVALPGPKIWQLDMATTTISKNKLWNIVESGQKTIPSGWAMDADGNPTTDATAARDGLLMPLGGYKGSGLGMLVEILTGVLGGGAMATELGGIRDQSQPLHTSQTFLAIDIQRFLPLDQFAARMESLAAIVKSSRLAAGFEEILLAGEPEWRTEAARLQTGIPFTETAWKPLAKLAEQLQLTQPGSA